MGNTSERHLHLVSFDIPYPANYGGAIDIFYKIRSLCEQGIKVHLHCSQYDRTPHDLLEALCETVAYYPRDLSWIHLFSNLPYIVKTRANTLLLKALQNDDYPILFEGIHSCAGLAEESLKGRHKIVRTHNIEHEYYSNLGRVENNPLKKLYFYREATKLERFEEVFRHSSGLAAISLKDSSYLAKKFPDLKVETVSAFHPFNKVDILPGDGNYALYHGSLEVGENNKAAIFLIKEVFSKLEIPFIIAGNNPSKELISLAAQFPDVTLNTNVSTDQIYEMVREAQVNILPTFQATGIKLKLLAALFTGRHCLVNTPMIEKTGLESLCQVCDSPEEMRNKMIALFTSSFTTEEIASRKALLESGFFSNVYNIEKLVGMIFE